MGVFKDLKGKIFNRLTVIEISHRKKRIFWLCKCTCGKETKVAGTKLSSGHTQSCGCLQQERAGKAAYKHGLRCSRFYSTWKAMINRCDNPKYKGYKHYGGRGIKVCDEWKNSIETFHKWCEENNFEEGLTLDRKDVNSNYEPGNCRWATKVEQANNTTRTLYVYIDGVQFTASEIYAIYGMSKSCIHKFSKEYENFSDAIKQWNLNKILVKNQWNTTRTITKNKL